MIRFAFSLSTTSFLGFSKVAAWLRRGRKPLRRFRKSPRRQIAKSDARFPEY